MTARTSSTHYYRPELDVVRFLAFLLVFLFHTLPSTKDPRVAGLLKGLTPAYDAFNDACGFGLSVFFTLSAFLICELLLRERAAVGSIGIKRFYIRRILRIWPLYYLGVALGVGFAFMPGADPATALKMGWFAIFMGAWFCATHGVLNNPANVLWSVSVEEQFYLFVPWIIKYFRRKWLLVFCLVVTIAANVQIFNAGRVGAPNPGVWFNSCIQFEFFAGGILLCLILDGRAPRFSAWQRLGLLILSFCCMFYACYGLHAIFGSHGTRNPGGWPLTGGYALALLGSVLLLLSFLGLRSSLLPKWAIYLGQISYGLYIFHEFAIFLTDHFIVQQIAMFKDSISNFWKGLIFIASDGVALGLTILAAAVSHRYFESPFLAMKRRYAVIESQPAERGVVRIGAKE